MTNLPQKQPDLLQIPTKYGVLRYEMPKDLSSEKQAILEAYLAPKINTVSDSELDDFTLRQINQALILLGHSRQLNDANEQGMMSDAISEIIRGKYHFLTMQEVGLIFKMGVQGDFKNSPEEVVMINVEKVHSWIKAYLNAKRGEVIATLKPAEPEKLPPADYNPESDFEILLQKVRNGQEVSQAEWICQTAQHYDRLNKSASFTLTADQRRAIFQEERDKLVKEGKNRMLHISTETRFMFRAFMENQPGENQYEKEVATICRIRVFREYVETLAKQTAA